MTCADEDTVIAVEILPGQAGDAPRLEPMLTATVEAVGPVEELVADDLRKARRAPP